MKNTQQICGMCRKQPARRICKNCGLGTPLYYCYECDYQIHSISPASSHQREPIGINILSPAKTLPQNPTTSSPIFIEENKISPLKSMENRTNFGTQSYIDQLKNYYKNERNEYENRIKSLENAHLDVKSTLENEICSLKQRLEEVSKESVTAIQETNYQNSIKLKEILREKDKLIEELHFKAFFAMKF